MANRTKNKQRKIYLTDEKSAALDAYLKSKGLKLQDFVEAHIDEVLKKNEK